MPTSYQEVDVSALIPATPCSDVLWDGTRFVLDVGGYLLTSADGVTWALPGIALPWIGFDGTTYVTVSAPTIAATSTDLVTWATHALPGATDWKGVCWAGALGLFVAVGTHPGDVHKIMTSPDGVTWTDRSAPTTADDCYAVIWAASTGTLVAITQAGVLTSTNGTAWTGHATPAGYEFSVDNGRSALAWSPALGLFVLPMRQTTTGDHVLVTSPDGVTWTVRTPPHSTDRRIKGIVWAPAPATFYALMVDTGGGVNAGILESPDGATWTYTDTGLPGYWLGLTWDDSAQTLVAGPWGAASVLTGLAAAGSTVRRVTPVQGRTAGGRLVRITGTGFSGTPAVLFDGVAATDVTVFNSTRLTARTPAHVAGLVDVSVDGVTLAGAFTYTDTVFGELTIRVEQNITVDNALNDAPDSAHFRSNATGDPTLGQTLRIADPASGAVLFGGSALVIAAGVDAQPANPGYRDITCGDLAWRLNAKRPHGTWTDVSWSDVVQDLFDSFAPDFVPDIEPGLLTVSVKFDRSKTFTECLSEGNQLARANFVADDNFGVKIFTVDTADPPDAITDDTPLYDPPPTVTTDLTQIRTRIYVHGAGGADSFEAGVSGPATGGASHPAVTPTTGGAIPSSPYGYWLSYVTAGGETSLFPLTAGSFSPIVNPGSTAYSLTDLDSSVSPDLRVTGRRIWRTKSGNPFAAINPIDPQYAFLVATLGNTPGIGEDTVLDGAADAALTVRAPKTDTTGTIFEMVEDTAAQIALAALLNVDGGTDDGVRDGYVNDPTLTTSAMAIARGQAELALWKDPTVTAVFAARDEKLVSGQSVPINWTNPAYPCVGTFKIQHVAIDQVAIDGLEGMLFARRTVTASSVRLTLDDLLRGVLLGAGGTGGGGGGSSSSSGGTGGGVPPSIPEYGPEVPAGTIDGVNTIFTLAHVYRPGVPLVKNGLAQTPTTDYAESGPAEITLVVAPKTGDSLLVPRYEGF